ncbi:hypothetical protein [Photobacterium galatheae]|uniref:Uncharacterized protein n=1 Tax=Photobacterium galatheae TaxID=1654360 RepID=A0A066RN34_9GAMM|nr:hypothetical protein [Photobacterium galatheae]KDM91865.1 hypothetical protein EA58_09045 [Photobacterium galatheae]MCM0147722.1 hypothetical protein [Photobacterium galatheae]
MSQIENTVKEIIDTAWFVGATYGEDEQLDNFIEKGIWQNGYSDKYLEQVRSMCSDGQCTQSMIFLNKTLIKHQSKGRC